MRTAELTNRRSSPADDVVLLDQSGVPIGRADRVTVHSGRTPLHLAFSCYLFNSAGQVLVTRRALGKATWPGVWTNACCGHPRPGERVEDAIVRRVREELGMQVGGLVPMLPDFRYQATDASGVLENEICPVYAVFGIEQTPAPNPDEVAEWAWLGWDHLQAAVAATPRVFSPWAAAQVPLLAAALDRCSGLQDAALPGLPAYLADVDALLGTELATLGRQWAAAIDGLDVHVLAADLPGWLAELLLGTGKRLRVRLAYWGFVSAGGSGADSYRHLVRLGAALEFLQLFALVHDDVMDGSVRRRGRPAARVQAADWHREAVAKGDATRFGDNLAILLGDLAHVQADRIVDGLPAEARALWYEMWTELIAGQRADLTGAAAGRQDLRHAERVAQLKSGRYSVTRPLQLGAALAGAGPDLLATLETFGDHLGRAFALRDDYLGLWGDPSVTGKPVNDDLLSGKATVLLALASDRLAGAARRLLGRVGGPGFTPADAAALNAAMWDAGLAAEIDARISAAAGAAVAVLAQGPLTASGVAGLRELTNAIAWRDA